MICRICKKHRLSCEIRKGVCEKCIEDYQDIQAEVNERRAKESGEIEYD